MSKKKKITIVVIVAFLLLSITMWYAFSEYFKIVPDSARAQIASWSFNTNFGRDEMSGIELSPRDGGKIAPGTDGEFQIKVDSKGSDVDVDYKVNIAEENLPLNMRFKIKGEDNEFNTMAELAKEKLHGRLNSDNQEKIYTIAWNWPFTNPEEDEVSISKDMDALKISNAGFKIEVVGEQAK